MLNVILVEDDPRNLDHVTKGLEGREICGQSVVITPLDEGRVAYMLISQSPDKYKFLVTDNILGDEPSKSRWWGASIIEMMKINIKMKRRIAPKNLKMILMSSEKPSLDPKNGPDAFILKNNSLTDIDELVTKMESLLN